MEEGAEGLENRAMTDHTQQLPPGTAIGMAIGAEIAPADPAVIGTVRVGTEMGGGVDRTTAPSRGHDARWRGAGGLRVKNPPGSQGMLPLPSPLRTGREDFSSSGSSP